MESKDMMSYGTYWLSKSKCWMEIWISAGRRVPLNVELDLGGLGRSCAATPVGTSSASRISQ